MAYIYYVSSLYTNVPVTETIAIIFDRIFKDTDSFYGFDRIKFSELLKITASNCYFLFNKILYKQIDGLSMGNPIAPSLDNIFLCHIETILFRNCPSSFKPIFYCRYLDDTFVIFEEESQVTCFLNYINSLQDNIQFTVERENENKLGFLDVSVERLDDSFNLSIFRKQTHTSFRLKFYFHMCF